MGGLRIVPVLTYSQSRRTVEVNCAEQALKNSLTLKMDCPYSFADGLFERLLGPNAGLRRIKPDLFAMSFIYNPKNFVYLKASMKHRSNKVG